MKREYEIMVYPNDGESTKYVSLDTLISFLKHEAVGDLREIAKAFLEETDDLSQEEHF